MIQIEEVTNVVFVQESIYQPVPTKRVNLSSHIYVTGNLEERNVDRLRQHFEVYIKAATLFLEKNTQYKDSIKIGGARGAMYEIIGGAGKLFSLFLEEPHKAPTTPEEREAILNVLIDLLNYSAIALLLTEEENWNGEWA